MPSAASWLMSRPGPVGTPTDSALPPVRSCVLPEFRSTIWVGRASQAARVWSSSFPAVLAASVAAAAGSLKR